VALKLDIMCIVNLNICDTQVEDLKTLANESPLSTPPVSPVKKPERPEKKRTGIMNLPMPPGRCFRSTTTLIYLLFLFIYFNILTYLFHTLFLECHILKVKKD
jgi:hypothetical protein